MQTLNIEGLINAYMKMRDDIDNLLKEKEALEVVLANLQVIAKNNFPSLSRFDKSYRSISGQNLTIEVRITQDKSIELFKQIIDIETKSIERRISAINQIILDKI